MIGAPSIGSTGGRRVHFARRRAGTTEAEMRATTLCYLERGGQYLMLHRIRKKNDPNHDKWIGVGGGIEEGETPEECLLREVREETGLTLIRYEKRGVIDFVSDEWEDEVMHLYTATGFTGEMKGDVGLSSAINSMAMVISIAITVILLLVML